MARDYKNSGKKKNARAAVPGWVWMLAGLSVGLLVALLVYLNQIHVAQHSPAVATTTKPATQAAAAKHAPTKTAGHSKTGAKAGSKAGGNGVRYEFYTLLPQSEVVIPDQELNERSKGPQAKTKPPGSYMLQAGSFRQRAEAKAFKGELALLGIVASIQNVTIGSDTWYRVRIGPFDTFAEITRVRARLRGNNINAIPVKIKG